MLQGDCRVLLDGGKLEGNSAVNGGAFFAGSTPCFKVLPKTAVHTISTPSQSPCQSLQCRHHRAGSCCQPVKSRLGRTARAVI